MKAVRNPKFVSTPANVIAKITNAMKNTEYDSIEELEISVPELVGKTQGEQAQILQDSGMELVDFESGEIPERNAPAIDSPIE